MIRTAEYNEIFDIAKAKLSVKYAGANIPTSSAFEEDAFIVLDAAVVEWNSTRAEENVISHSSLVSCKSIGHNDLVGVAEMRLTRSVCNRCG